MSIGEGTRMVGDGRFIVVKMLQGVIYHEDETPPSYAIFPVAFPMQLSVMEPDSHETNMVEIHTDDELMEWAHMVYTEAALFEMSIPESAIVRKEG